MADRTLVGGIEFGGTKTLLAIGEVDGTLLDRRTIPTASPDVVLPQIAAYLAGQAQARGPLAAIGAGAFGPIVIDPGAEGYGHLLETNKPGWSGFDLVGALETLCHAPVALVTDVAAAGIGEAGHGALRGIDLGVYLTVGTGIGGAILCRGEPLPALLHPEMGHISLQRRPDDDAPSTCRFHANCAEGLAAGPAIMARFGQSLSHCAPDSAGHRLVADYIGQLCANIVLTVSPQRIVLGGGVSQTPGLIAAVHAAMIAHLDGYAIGGTETADYLCLPQLGQDAGIIGALHLASRRAAARSLSAGTT